MALIAFDTLAYARRLIAVGVPEEQASVQAEVMAETLLHNVDSIVTTDFLDARLAEFEHKMDKRFGEMEVKFALIDGKFRLIYWMLGIVIASTTLPQLVSLFSR
jgi:hypothetical protein